VAVNPVTNRVYVANYNSATVSVIDGASNTVIAAPAVGSNPNAVAVNPVTNRVYVANYNSATVSVIDGASNTVIATPALGFNPYAVAVNPVTNKVYVANYFGSTMTVIDGATNGTTSVAVGSEARAIAVNPVTNKVYVAIKGTATVSVIDGASNAVIATPAVGSYSWAVAVNPVTNKVYVANNGSASVSVITEAPDNDTRVRAEFARISSDPLKGDTTSWDRPTLTGKAVNRSGPNRTKMMGVGNRWMTTQKALDWATVTSVPGTDSIMWSYTWGADSLIMGENFICAEPLESDAATSGNHGLGTPFAGNLAVYPLYRIPARHDVGTTRLLSPRGAIAVNSVVTPACSVFNYGNLSESYSVRMKIGGSYNNTALVSGHAAGARVYVTFPNWTAGAAGRYPVSCSTELNGDVYIPNNFIRDSVFVINGDVGCTRLVAPAGAYDSNVVVTPACSVYNFGTVTENYNVRMKIGSLYNRTAAVSGHAAGAKLYVTFPTWTTAGAGTYPVTCSTELTGDPVPSDDRQTGSVFVRYRWDVGVSRLLAPSGMIDSGSVVTPACSAYNYGSQTVNYEVRMRIGSFYDQTATVTVHLPGAYAYVTFPSFSAWPRGRWALSCSTKLIGDQVPGNDELADSVGVAVHDIGAVAIVAPSGTIPAGPMTPRVTVRNHGTVREACDITFTINSAAPYQQTVYLSNGLPVGADTTVDFPTWTAWYGSYTARCSTHLAEDIVPANNVASSDFQVQAPVTGWETKAGLPGGAKNKAVKDGGCITDLEATDAATFIYGLKGNGRCEFYQYSIAGDAWEAKESIPAVGSSGKKKAVKKGACITDADGVMFAAKGNGTLEWWKYDPALSGGPTYPWTEKTPVPAGAKAIKEGSGSAMVKVGDTTFIYFLKGSSTQEFYRYNATSNSWATMTNAPSGTSGKPYKNGSALCASEDGSTVFTVKGSYNEFYAYDVATNTWTTKAPLPFTGSSGKKKKVKDGAGLAFLNSTVYCLKGGGTREFWTWQADSDKWTQLEDMPAGGGKPVKGGGALTRANDKLYAFKGNNTLEFYSYAPASAVSSEQIAGSSAQTGDAQRAPAFSLSVSPTLFRAGATIHYSLPRAGNYSLKLYDITGQLVTTLASGYHNAGTSSLRLSPSSLSSGIYVLKLTTDGATTTVKLIVE
jgi:YVTN family beta-propeller protein